QSITADLRASRVDPKRIPPPVASAAQAVWKDWCTRWLAQHTTSTPVATVTGQPTGTPTLPSPSAYPLSSVVQKQGVGLDFHEKDKKEKTKSTTTTTTPLTEAEAYLQVSAALEASESDVRNSAMIATLLAGIAHIETPQKGRGLTVDTSGALHVQLTLKNTPEQIKFEDYYDY